MALVLLATAGCPSTPKPPPVRIVDVSPTMAEAYLHYMLSSVERAARAELDARGQRGGLAVGDEQPEMSSGGVSAQVVRVDASVLLLRVESTRENVAHDVCRAVVSRLERLHYDQR